jgi:CDP-4-dehydro-6-deoxyglucose reductase
MSEGDTAKWLSLARAAKLLGITRAALQEEIAAGHITTFEGKVKEAQLLATYPSLEFRRDTMLAQVEAIKEAALLRLEERLWSEEESLAARIGHLERRLAVTSRELYWYAQTLDEIMEKLSRIEQACGSETRIHIATLKSWLCQVIDSS